MEIERDGEGGREGRDGERERKSVRERERERVLCMHTPVVCW
jgi:hypothetical protein